MLSNLASSIKKKCDKYQKNIDSVNILLFFATILYLSFKLNNVKFYFDKFYPINVSEQMI